MLATAIKCLFQSVLKLQYVPDDIKRQFANKLKGASIESIIFINEFDPNTFLFIAKFSKETISNELALESYL